MILRVLGQNRQICPVLRVLGRERDCLPRCAGCVEEVSGSYAAGQIIPALCKIWIQLQRHPQASLRMLRLPILKHGERKIMEDLLIADHHARAELVNGSRKILLGGVEAAPHDLDLADAVERQRAQWVRVRATYQRLHSSIPLLYLHVGNAQIKLNLGRSWLDLSIVDEQSLIGLPISHPEHGPDHQSS